MEDGMIMALKSDLEAAEKRLNEYRRDYEQILRFMMKKTVDIEHYRSKLLEYGIKTLREQPWGKIEYVS